MVGVQMMAIATIAEKISCPISPGHQAGHDLQHRQGRYPAYPGPLPDQPGQHDDHEGDQQKADLGVHK
jgi:hypothetical protein